MRLSRFAVRKEWPIGTDVSISFPEELIRGRVVAVVPKLKDTELRVFYRSKSFVAALSLENKREQRG